MLSNREKVIFIKAYFLGNADVAIAMGQPEFPCKVALKETTEEMIAELGLEKFMPDEADIVSLTNELDAISGILMRMKK